MTECLPALHKAIGSAPRVTRKEGVFVVVVVKTGSHYVALAGLGSCFCLPRAEIKGVRHHGELEKRNREITQSDLYFMAKKTCASFHKLDTSNGDGAGRTNPAGGSRAHTLPIGSTAPGPVWGLVKKTLPPRRTLMITLK